MVTGLLSSVPEEGRLLIRQLKKKSTVSGRQFSKGRIGDRDVVYMVSGMGKTNAAHAATILLERFSPDRVILFGVGGAYPSSGLQVGDIAVAEKEVYGDEGVLMRNGFRDTELIGIPLLRKGRKKYFNEFILDKTLVRKTLKSFHDTPCPMPSATRIKSGTFVTVSSCTGTRKRALELQKRFGALCENMEGASVAHICTLYGIPLLEIRGISNIVEDRDRATWDVMLAAENCQRAVQELLRDL
jgi:futalosine hydrolase